ncbi:MAG: hypothetical protein RJA57_7 [Bacteroidota bacterium]
MLHRDEAIDYALLRLGSPVFRDGGAIPQKYTCDGADVSPPLDITGIPEEAVCLALILDDPDAPRGTWLHWLAWNIPLTRHLKEGHVHGVSGTNDFGHVRYNGPCPPSGIHHYRFKIYALDRLLDLPAGSRLPELQEAMAGHILAFGEMTGTSHGAR